MQSVGTHFKLSSPLNNETRAKLDRRGVCVSCHKTIPDGDLAVSLMHHIAETTGVEVDNKMHKDILNKTMRIGAWVQVVGGLLGGLILLWIVWRVGRKL